MKKLVFSLLLITQVHFAQTKLMDRLSGLEHNSKASFYNTDGYAITHQDFDFDFTDEGLKNLYEKLQIEKTDKIKSDKILVNHVYTENETTENGIIQKNNYYIFERNAKTSVVLFSKCGITDKETETELVNAIIDKKVPQEVFVSQNPREINMAGKKIRLSSSCYWMELNTVNCPDYGMMNWSLHKNLESAQNAVLIQEQHSKARKMTVVSEDLVDVKFENTDTKAKKIVYKIGGFKGFLTKLTGSNTLVVYYLAEKIGDKNLSCVMSYWNNDYVNPQTNLPPLLESVMRLK